MASTPNPSDVMARVTRNGAISTLNLDCTGSVTQSLQLSGTMENQATSFAGNESVGRRFSITIRKRKSFISQRLRNARRRWLGSLGVSDTSSGGKGGSSLTAIGIESDLIRSKFPVGIMGQIKTYESTTG